MKRYGKDIQVYVALQCNVEYILDIFILGSTSIFFEKKLDLLQKNINPASIVLIVPPSKNPAKTFDNPIVEKKVIFFNIYM